MKFEFQTLTTFNRCMNVISTLVVDPVETGLYSEPGEHSVLGPIAVAGGQVHRSAFVVQRLKRMQIGLVPAFENTQTYAGPLVHDANR